MPASPLFHFCLHVDPAVHASERFARHDGPTDPAAALANWVRNDSTATQGLNGSRIASVTIGIGLHVAAFALLIGAATPNLPIALGESEVDALEIEFLPPASEPLPVAPAPPVVQPAPVIVQTPRIVTLAPPTVANPPTVLAPEAAATETIPEPVSAPPVTAAAAPQSSAESAPAPERPLTTRGKRAQSQYLRELMLWLARHRVYPAEARKQKLEGVVQVRFSIDRDGHLLSASVHRSAGIELLDTAALDVLRRADPMPKFPKALERNRLSVTLPIDFSLITD